MRYEPPAHRGLDIVYQDSHYLVVNKPSGLLSVPGRGEDKADCMVSRVKQAFPEVLVVHRLDMSTSGIMLLARSLEAQGAMGKLFEHRQVAKTYIAVVAGECPLEGYVDLPLIIDWPNRPRQIVDHEQGRSAYTQYHRLDFSQEQGVSRVSLHPKTGRTHQLRVHMASIGHPILGDDLYAPEQWVTGQPRLHLHAQSLRFEHPFTKEPLLIESLSPF
jgi:tRNA pseudouridine32 synthase/23S rRNA pseudouridine746 synthase